MNSSAFGSLASCGMSSARWIFPLGVTAGYLVWPCMNEMWMVEQGFARDPAGDIKAVQAAKENRLADKASLKAGGVGAMKKALEEEDEEDGEEVEEEEEEEGDDDEDDEESSVLKAPALYVAT